MAITLVWDNPEKTILRHIYDGEFTTDDFYRAARENYDLQQTVSHPVIVISDLTGALKKSKMLISAAGKYSEKYLPENQRAVIVVNPDAFTRVMLSIAKSVAPGTTSNLYTVSTLSEAYDLIATLGLS